MARRRVTYLEVADERPRRPGAGGSVLDLGLAAPLARPARPPIRPQRPACPAWLAQLALVALLASGVVLDRATTGPDEQAALDRAGERRRPEVADPSEPAVVEPVAVRSGPVLVPVRSVVDEPWSGVFDHHPDLRASEDVARVHVLTAIGDGGRAVLVVDATRRAFTGPEHPVDLDRPPRVLGSALGTGVRTLQWDAGGYGLSLTTVGATAQAQHALAAAVRLPEGASLQDGRPPTLDADTLRQLDLAVTGLRGGSATSLGSPLIGQGGGAAIEGQLHRAGAETLLLSVVRDQLATAKVLRDGLGPTVAIDASSLHGITTAAALDHGPATALDRRIRGWARLVLDHEGGATIELSSDVLRPAELLDAARAMDLDRLVRTAAPLGGAPG